MKTLHLYFDPIPRLIKEPDLFDLDHRTRLIPAFEIFGWQFRGLYHYARVSRLTERVNELICENSRLERRVEWLEQHVEEHKDQLQLGLAEIKRKAGLR